VYIDIVLSFDGVDVVAPGQIVVQGAMGGIQGQMSIAIDLFMHCNGVIQPPLQGT
jgi:hypothetical protein